MSPTGPKVCDISLASVQVNPMLSPSCYKGFLGPKAIKVRREVVSPLGATPLDTHQPAGEGQPFASYHERLRVEIPAESHICDDDEETYLITIQYVPPIHLNEDMQSSLFKTRGRHLVEKVLRMACKTFKVDYVKEK